MGRFNYSLRTLLAAIAAMAIVLWFYRLSPPVLLTLAAFFMFIVYPVLIVGQSDAVKGLLIYAAVILLFVGGFCFLVARLILIYY